MEAIAALYMAPQKPYTGKAHKHDSDKDSKAADKGDKGKDTDGVIGSYADSAKSLHVDVSVVSDALVCVAVVAETQRTGTTRVLGRAYVSTGSLAPASLQLSVEYDPDAGQLAVSLGGQLVLETPCDVAAALELLPQRSHAWISLAVPQHAAFAPGPSSLTSWHFRGQAAGDASASGEPEPSENATCHVCGCEYSVLPFAPASTTNAAASGDAGSALNNTGGDVSHGGAIDLTDVSPGIVCKSVRSFFACAGRTSLRCEHATVAVAV